MDLDLGNKLALVTGSTAGIGLAIAKRFAVEGARVIINGRTKERVAKAFVASPLSSCINGAALRCEGGLLRTIL